MKARGKISGKSGGYEEEDSFIMNGVKLLQSLKSFKIFLGYKLNFLFAPSPIGEDPDPVIFGLSDPDKVIFSFSQDPTCNN